ncbi:MAG: hypothetical protein AAGC60_00545 [Acidobacteriota bacterium]
MTHSPSLLQRAVGWLRPTLFTNATFSGLAAILAIDFASALGPWLGAEPALLRSLGVELGLFALAVGFVAWRLTPERPWTRYAVLAIAVLDLLWVAASVALLLAPTSPLTVAGTWVVALQALAVLDFGLIQLAGWRGLGASNARLEVVPVAG